MVDDQFVSQQSIYYFFDDLGLTDRLMMFSNGRDAVQHFDWMLKQERSQQHPKRPQPVSLIFLDINMPIMTGLEAIKLIKQKYEEANLRVQSEKEDGWQIVRPVIFFFSQFDRKGFSSFISSEERADFYLEKPVA